MQLDSLKKLRIQVFKRLLFLVTLFMIVLCFKNFYEQQSSLYFLEVVFSIVGIISYLNFDDWATPRTIKMFAMIFTNITFCILMYVLIIEGFHSTSYIWVTAIPILSYMLNGIRIGLKLSFFYLGLTCIILISKEYLQSSDMSFDSLLDIVFLVIIIWVLAHFYENTNRQARKQLIEMAIKDSLTGLYNRHAFYSYFDKNKQSKIGVILIDLDFFKSVNDHYGHDAGDFVLTEVATILKRYQKDDTQAFRMGGEEFLMMTVDLDYEQVCDIAHQIHVDIREHHYVHEGRLLELTASMGVEVSDTPPSSLTNLMKYADYKLYEAKATGRNRVIKELPKNFDYVMYGRHKKV